MKTLYTTWSMYLTTYYIGCALVKQVPFRNRSLLERPEELVKAAMTHVLQQKTRWTSAAGHAHQGHKVRVCSSLYVDTFYVHSDHI